MYDNTIKDKFIELCGQGLTVEAAAEQLNVGRSSAFNWARQFHATIHNLKTMRFHASRERVLGPYEDRLKLAVARLRKYEQEMDGRDPKYMDMKELQDLIDDARAEVDKLSILPTFIEQPEDTTNENATS